MDVDVLISGKVQSLNFDEPLKHQFEGFTFVYEGGGVNWINTLLNIKPIPFIKDVKKLNLDDYDLVVTDFEPVSAWARCYKNIV